jgi:hypothetical protein
VQPGPKIPSFKDNPQAGSVPPLLPASEPPPPPLPKPNRKSLRVEQTLAILLSLCLGAFLADAVVSLADDTLILFFGLHLFAVVRGIVFLFAILMAALVYVLLGITPMIPKRLFLPVTLFNPVAILVGIPFLIYHYGRMQEFSRVVSICRVLFGLVILYRLLGGFKFRWRLVTKEQLGTRRFTWLNLAAFVLVNIFGVLPAIFLYLGLCASLAVDHFSEGFFALRPNGLTVQVRKYVRNDGKVIRLIPMSHVADSDFYRKVSQSFPTNSIILMEGVTDEKNLLTNKISYKRMAKSLGLAEQHEEFAPMQGEMVRADVDVEQFSSNTIDMLNLAMIFHSQGVNAGTVLKLTQYSPPPGFEKQLIDDLIRKRNRHLLEEIQARLPESDNLMVPWGVIHMPEIAREIQKSGFRLVETEEYRVIRFRFAGKQK